MTQTSTARRAATVSGGALVLCLSFGGTALAASAPASGSTDPVGTLTGALPTPTPSLPAPVGQVVQQVTQAAGIPDPAAQPTATPTPVPTGKKGRVGKPTAHAPAPAVRPAQHQRTVLGLSRSRVAGPAMPVGGVSLAGLRGVAPSVVTPVSNPVVAPQQTLALAAGQTPALAPHPQGLLPAGDGDSRSPRGLFIALATLVIGALAAGHVKVIQDRLGGIAAS
jgi:hypothetical protein